MSNRTGAAGHVQHVITAFDADDVEQLVSPKG